MRDLYRPDEDQPIGKFKDIKKMTPAERQEAVRAIYASSRAYINQITEKFLKSFDKKDRFSISAKMGIINTLPPQYNELFIRRISRLRRMAQSVGYEMRFSKWKTTKEYGWFFVRGEKGQ
jgi:hypothetical protein